MSGQEDGSWDAWVGVMVMASWKGSYYSWNFGRVVGSFHWGGCGEGGARIGGGGGARMEREVGMMTSGCKDRPNKNVGKGCVTPLI